MKSLILAFALQAIFPIFSSTVGEFTGLSLVNADDRAREYTVTVTPETGTTPRSGRVPVPAGAQRAQLLNEIIGGPVSGPGWIRVGSDTASPYLYLTSGNAEALDGTEPALSLSTTLLLPYLEINTGFAELNHTDTLIAIVNPNTESASTTTQLFGLDGKLVAETTVAVPANGSRTLRVSEAFQTALPSNGLGGKIFQGYARLSSSQAIAAWQRIDTPLSRSMLRGTPSEEIPKTADAVFPHFVFGGNYGSVINLLNPTSAPITLDLTAFDDRGNILGQTIPWTLAAGEARRSSVSELFRIPVILIFPPPIISGYVRVRSTQGPSQVIGNIDIFTLASGGRQSTLLSPLATMSSTNWVIPFGTSAGSYYTGYAVVNANELLTVQTDITVEVIASDGTVFSRSTSSLSPRQRITGNLPRGLQSGYIRIRSSLPVYTLGSVGTADGRQMEQIPALP